MIQKKEFFKRSAAIFLLLPFFAVNLFFQAEKQFSPSNGGLWAPPRIFGPAVAALSPMMTGQPTGLLLPLSTAQPSEPRAGGAGQKIMTGDSFSKLKSGACFELLGYEWSLVDDSLPDQAPLEEDELPLLMSQSDQRGLPAQMTEKRDRHPAFVKETDRLLLSCRFLFQPGSQQVERVDLDSFIKSLKGGFLFVSGEFCPTDLNREGGSTTNTQLEEEEEGQDILRPCRFTMELELLAADLCPEPFSVLQWPRPEIRDESGSSLIKADTNWALRESNLKSTVCLPPLADGAVSLLQIRTEESQQNLNLFLKDQRDKNEKNSSCQQSDLFRNLSLCQTGHCPGEPDWSPVQTGSWPPLSKRKP